MRKLMIYLALVVGASAVQAANNGFYIGAGVSQAKLKDVGQDFGAGNLDDFKIDNTAWKAIAGFKAPVLPLAVELNYDDLGSDSRTVNGVAFNANSKAFAAYAVGFLPLPLPILDLYGKAGLARWTTDAHAAGLFDFDEHGTEFAWGGGAQVHFGGLGARLEYERYNVRHTNGVELLTLGVTWTFL